MPAKSISLKNLQPLHERYTKGPSNYTKDMNTITHKIIIRDDSIRKDGTALICLQAFVNKKRVVIGLNRFCKPEHFDKREQHVIKAKDAREINLVLDNARSRATEIATRYYLQERPITKDAFVQQFLKPELRYDFIQWILAKIESEWKHSRAEGTIRHYRNTLNLLQKIKGNFTFGSIDYQFILDIENYMTKLKYHQNNKWKQHKNFKAFINEAIKCDIYIQNPYKKFPLKMVKSERVFLDEKELNRFKDLYTANILTPELQEELRRFLFTCYTGLRLSDSIRVTNECIIADKLVFLPYKTRKLYKMLTIDLTNNAKQYLQQRTGLLFNLKSEVHANRLLREIAGVIGTKKHITTHVGRHTFATLFLLKGGSVEALREIMGHSKMETTMAYVHILDESKKKQIHLMDT